MNVKKSAGTTFAGFLLVVLLAACHNNNSSSLREFMDTRNSKPNSFYVEMLEQFCQDYYSVLYHDLWGTRTYVPGTLQVDSITRDSDKEVTIYGIHDFKGRMGKVWKGAHFKANIYESKQSNNEYIITFEKESQRIFSGKKYTESRTKTIHYEK